MPVPGGPYSRILGLCSTMTPSGYADNGITGGIWRTSYRIMGMAEDIIANSDVVPEVETRNAFIATGNLFKAISLGNLYMFWPLYPDNVDIEGTFRVTKLEFDGDQPIQIEYEDDLPIEFKLEED